MGFMGYGFNNNEFYLLDTSWIFYYMAVLYCYSSRLLAYKNLW